VTLKHELRASGLGVPELDASVLGPGQYPRSIGRQSNAENKVLDGD
jgi:hypothetical protein